MYVAHFLTPKTVFQRKNARITLLNLMSHEFHGLKIVHFSRSFSLQICRSVTKTIVKNERFRGVLEVRSSVGPKQFWPKKRLPYT